MDRAEEEKGREASPVVLRLFGVDVRRVDSGKPDEDDDADMELKKSSSMPNLTSIDPPLHLAHAEKSFAFMASGLETASSAANSLELGIAVTNLELSIAPPTRCGCGGA